MNRSSDATQSDARLHMHDIVFIWRTCASLCVSAARIEMCRWGAGAAHTAIGLDWNTKGMYLIKFRTSRTHTLTHSHSHQQRKAERIKRCTRHGGCVGCVLGWVGWCPNHIKHALSELTGMICFARLSATGTNHILQHTGERQRVRAPRRLHLQSISDTYKQGIGYTVHLRSC